MDEKDMDRFLLSYVDIDGCWIWIRALFRDGYGAATVAGKTRRAHRVSFELANGIILTKDELIHHVCRNKACINPRHLEITTQTTHVDSAVFGNKERTHCPYGHEYTIANTYWNNNGKQRECYQCKLVRSRRQYKRNKQNVQARLKMLADKYRKDDLKQTF